MAAKFKHTRTRSTQFTPIVLDALKPDPDGHPYEIAEPGGLRVVVGKLTTTFVYRYKSPVTGKSCKLLIGRYPGKSLTDARSDMNAARDKVLQGIDPQSERKLIQVEKRAAPTVGALVDEFIAAQPMDKRSRQKDADYLRHDVLPLWKDVKVTSVTRRDVKALIADKALTAPISACQLLGYVRRLFGYAVDQEHIEVNPAAGIKPPAKTKSRQRVLDHDEIRRFWDSLDSLDTIAASAPVKLVLRFCLVTGQRGGEVLQMRWSDITGDWWTVPATVSKNKLAHRVYLSPMARDIIEQARAIAGESDRVFKGKRKVRDVAGEEVADYLIDRSVPLHALKRSQEKLKLAPFGIHDLRRTAASQMAAAGVPRAIIGKVLNHAERGVTAVYDRHSYDAEKAEALTILSDVLQRIVGGAGAAAPADPRTLEAQLAQCEAEHATDPNAGRHAVVALALSFRLHRTPPRWAIDAFLAVADKQIAGENAELTRTVKALKNKGVKRVA